MQKKSKNHIIALSSVLAGALVGCGGSGLTLENRFTSNIVFTPSAGFSGDSRTFSSGTATFTHSSGGTTVKFKSGNRSFTFEIPSPVIFDGATYPIGEVGGGSGSYDESSRCCTWKSGKMTLKATPASFSLGGTTWGSPQDGTDMFSTNNSNVNIGQSVVTQAVGPNGTSVVTNDTSNSGASATDGWQNPGILVAPNGQQTLRLDSTSVTGSQLYVSVPLSGTSFVPSNSFPSVFYINAAGDGWVGNGGIVSVGTAHTFDYTVVNVTMVPNSSITGNGATGSFTLNAYVFMP